MPTSLGDQREALVSVVEYWGDDVEAIVASMPADPVAAQDYLLATAPGVLSGYVDAAGVLAADWYDEIRALVDADPYSAEPVDLVGFSDRVDANVRWSVGPLFAGAAAAVVAGKLFGAGQRLIVDGHRQTVANASISDPAAKGWARYGSLGSCDFCNMLISRGADYHVGTDFASHDHCNCLAGPSFEEARSVSRYVPTSRSLSERTRNRNAHRVRTWIADNT